MSDMKIVCWDEDERSYVPATQGPADLASDADMAAAMARSLHEKEQELERLGAWYEASKARVEKSIAFARTVLESYAKHEAKKSGLKSFPVGIATVSVSKARATTHWPEREDWMKRAVVAGYRREKVELDRAAIKKDLIEWTDPDAEGFRSAVLKKDVPGLGAEGDILPGLVQDTHPGEVTVKVEVPR